MMTSVLMVLMLMLMMMMVIVVMVVVMMVMMIMMTVKMVMMVMVVVVIKNMGSGTQKIWFRFPLSSCVMLGYFHFFIRKLKGNTAFTYGHYQE